MISIKVFPIFEIIGIKFVNGTSIGTALSVGTMIAPEELEKVEIYSFWSRLGDKSSVPTTFVSTSSDSIEILTCAFY